MSKWTKALRLNTIRTGLEGYGSDFPSCELKILEDRVTAFLDEHGVYYGMDADNLAEAGIKANMGRGSQRNADEYAMLRAWMQIQLTKEALTENDAAKAAKSVFHLMSIITDFNLDGFQKAIRAGYGTMQGGRKSAQQTNATYSRPSKEQLIAEMDRIKAQTGAGRTEVIKRAAKKLGIGKSTAYNILKE